MLKRADLSSLNPRNDADPPHHHRPHPLSLHSHSPLWCRPRLSPIDITHHADFAFHTPWNCEERRIWDTLFREMLPRHTKRRLPCCPALPNPTSLPFYPNLPNPTNSLHCYPTLPIAYTATQPYQ
ncbi:hypothetical protein Pcinc_011642 [Petrolisthes cinctipes]|uniref:Uncharacterized protein n=1 Tax=Petrolisthes cinctipes TaxID=88211 RepID=A0AAE1KSB4_PETCI|nr:hypothetical protein Pcinc_011642 [Petrolisthes cinctipes]